MAISGFDAKRSRSGCRYCSLVCGLFERTDSYRSRTSIDALVTLLLLFSMDRSVATPLYISPVGKIAKVVDVWSEG